jgi:hypothetical protein
MLVSLVETGTQSDRRQSCRRKTYVQVSFVLATSKTYNICVSDIPEQGDDDILLDLGPQVVVAEKVHSKEKDIACGLTVNYSETNTHI